jgi:predicted secreted hydrolase
MTLKATGPTLPDLGAGVIPFADGRDYEYAFPCMATSGTLTVNGKLYNVTGTSWLDREWGKFGESKWTWMCIHVDKGPKISIWDQQNSNDNPNSYVGGQAFATAFATILNLDDSLSVTSATIKELSSGLIPNTNRTYANRWSVKIPGRAELTVSLLKDQQEIKSDMIPRIEGKCLVKEGENVTGVAFVELCNLFPFFRSSNTNHETGKPMCE